MIWASFSAVTAVTLLQFPVVVVLSMVISSQPGRQGVFLQL